MTKIKGFTTKESDFIRHTVRELWDEMWAKAPVQREVVFADLNEMRGYGMITSLELGEWVKNRYKVTPDTAAAMVASWRDWVRGGGK